MLISDTMNLDHLAEHMGRDCSKADARNLRPLLVAEFDGIDTADVPDQRWMALVIEADASSQS